MKAKKLHAGALLFAFILLSLFIFSFINPAAENQPAGTGGQTAPAPPEGPNTAPDKFLIGAIGSYNGANMNAYNEAGFNITHIYTETADPGLVMATLTGILHALT